MVFIQIMMKQLALSGIKLLQVPQNVAHVAQAQ